MCKFHSLYSLCLQNTSHFLTLIRKEYPDRIPCVVEISRASQDLPSQDKCLVPGGEPSVRKSPGRRAALRHIDKHRRR